jgi:hypothetical protein
MPEEGQAWTRPVSERIHIGPAWDDRSAAARARDYNGWDWASGDRRSAERAAPTTETRAEAEALLEWRRSWNGGAPGARALLEQRRT